MNKNGKTTIIVGFILLVILTSSIYLMLPGKVRIDIGKTSTAYSVWENEEWTLAATEYVNIYDGTTKMRAKSRDLNYSIDDKISKVVRTSVWKDNITTIQTYTFDGSLDDVVSFPISNEFECINCEGKIVHYEIRDILYNGETKIIESPFSFGHNMKIEWEDGAYFHKVYQQKSSDKIIIKYRPTNSYENYSVRLYDPPGSTLNLTSGTTILGGNLTYDWVNVGAGATIQVNESIGYLNITGWEYIIMDGIINGSGIVSTGSHQGGDGEVNDTGGIPGYEGSSGAGGAGQYYSGGSGGDADGAIGGINGTGSTNSSRLYLQTGSVGGDGGGEGSPDVSPIGGNGGAFIKLKSNNISISGIIYSNGYNGITGERGFNSDAIGGGGGGSAGRIVLEANYIYYNGPTFYLNGGDGGDGDATGTWCAGGGGGGSAGVLLGKWKVSHSGSFTTSSIQGAAGSADDSCGDAGIIGGYSLSDTLQDTSINIGTFPTLGINETIPNVLKANLDNVYMNITAFDIDNDSIVGVFFTITMPNTTILVNDQNGTWVSGDSTSFENETWTSPTFNISDGADYNGDYDWSITLVSNGTPENKTYTGTFTADTIIPSLIIESPTNTSYNNIEQLVNLTSDGSNTWYNWNGTNYTYSSEINITFNEGSNTLFAYSNDSVGNLNTTSVSFTILKLRFISPTPVNNTILDVDNSVINVNASLNLSSCNLTFDYSKDIQTFNLSTDLNHISEISYGDFIAASDNTILKYDNNGNLIWSTSLGDNFYYSVDIIEDSDGNFIFVGDNPLVEYVIKKFNPQGGLIWEKSEATSNKSQYNTIVETNDGRYMVGGMVYYGGYQSATISIYNKNGTLEAYKLHGGNNGAAFNDILKTSDSRYIVIGLTDSWHSGQDRPYLVEVNSSGDFVDYNITYDDYQTSHGYSIKETSDGNFVFYVYTYGVFDNIIIKVNSSNGLEIWNSTVSGLYRKGGLVVDHQNNIAVTGGPSPFQEQIRIFDNDGQSITNYTYDTGPYYIDISLTSYGGYVLAGASPNKLNSTFGTAIETDDITLYDVVEYDYGTYSTANISLINLQPGNYDYYMSCYYEDIFSSETRTLTIANKSLDIIINSPTNTTYSNLTQLINISSNGSNVWYNWNGTNITYTSTINTTFNEGSNTLIIYTNDSLGNENNTQVIFSIDIPPTILVQSPTNTTYSTSTIYFNATADESIDTWIANYNGTNVTITINTSLEVEDGSHQLLLYGNDTAGGWGLNDSIYFTVDSTYPQFSSYWDDNRALNDTGIGNFNVTVENTNGTVLLEINGENVTATNLTSNVYNVSYNFTDAGNYTYKWHSWGNGTLENYNVSIDRNYILNSTIAPLIVIETPVNTTYNNAIQLLNITSNGDNIWYNWNGTNITYTAAINITFDENTNTVTVYVNFSDSGLENTTSVTFTIDTTAPSLEIITPTNTTYSSALQLVNITSDGDNTWYNWNGTNITYTTAINITFDEGVNTLIAYSNDSIGNLNTTSVSFTVDTTAPSLVINTPANTTYTNATQLVNISTSDSTSGVDSTWYSWNSTNATYTSAANVIFSEGVNTLIVYSNDSVGNENTTQVIFTIDTIGPSLIIESPANISYTNKTQLINLTSDGVSTWYNWNGTNVTYTAAINTTFEVGINTLTAYSNDTHGNLNTTQFIFVINATEIILINPDDGTISENATINFTANLSDSSGIENATLWIYFTNGTLFNQTTVVISGAVSASVGVVVSMVDGVFNWFYRAVNSIGYENVSENRTITGGSLFDFNITVTDGADFYFYPESATSQQVEPNDQTDSIGIFTVNNNLTYNIVVWAKLNTTNSGVSLSIGNSSNYSTAVSITDSYNQIYYNLTINSTVYFWAWADYNHPDGDWFPELEIKGELL